MHGTGSEFRKLHEEIKAFVMTNSSDIGTARILTTLGFKALATTSSGMAFAMEKPDGALTPDEVLHHCATLVCASNLPISVDLAVCRT